MANTNGTRKNDGDAEERKATRRVVLRRERVLVVPEGDIDREKVREALGLPKRGPALELTDAWIVVGEFEGQSKTKAIEAHAGKAGTPDAKQGAYKAPSVSAWSGGERYEAPPAPLVARIPLED